MSKSKTPMADEINRLATLNHGSEFIPIPEKIFHTFINELFKRKKISRGKAIKVLKKNYTLEYNNYILKAVK